MAAKRTVRARRTPRRVSRPLLRKLADRLGILDGYVNLTGRRIVTTDAAREALLALMGFDAPTEDAAAGWLAELDHEERETIIDPVRVVVRDSRDAGRVRVRLPVGIARADVELTLTEEAGGLGGVGGVVGGHVWRADRELSGRGGWLELSHRAPLGYHTLAVVARSDGREWRADQALIVVPGSCVTTDSVLAGRKAMGVVANLYALRREADWGVGDMSTLMALVEWTAARGGAFVGVNPLHALFNRGNDVSPYSPVSRLFRNHIYIDVERVPEFDEWAAQESAVRAARREAVELHAGALVNYDGVIALKERVLAELHRIFRAGTGESGAERRRKYGEFLRARDPELTRFATWMTIAESARMPDWRRWPDAMRDPESESLRAFQEAHAERVDFFRWLQFETHQQLGASASRARALGMPIGVYQDLAIGTSPGGSDTWSYPDLFVTGASVGAPPDPYSATGQVWGLPPLNPRALRQQRYRYWIQLLRRAFDHAGALRIDHVMGLFRQYWVPDGLPGTEGAYVRFPANDLLGILALESVRHHAIVVGEDLGTVPSEVPPALRKWGILSSKVMYFERDARGFLPLSRYVKHSLATANTHDMPTLAGFWSGHDIELRAKVGLLATAADVRRARRARVKDRKSLLARVGLAVPRHFEEPHFPRVLAGAVHDFLCAAPAALVGISLDDLTGELEPVNVPGVGQDKYPCWRRRSRMTVEEISWSFEVDDAMRCKKRRGQPA